METSWKEIQRWNLNKMEFKLLNLEVDGDCVQVLQTDEGGWFRQGGVSEGEGVDVEVLVAFVQGLGAVSRTHWKGSEVDEGGVDEGGVDESGVKEGGVDEGGVKEGGVDEGGVDEGGVDEGGEDEGGSWLEVMVEEEKMGRWEKKKSEFARENE